MSGYQGHVSRAEIGLRRPRSVSHSIDPSGTAIHYLGGNPASLSSHADCLSMWRGIQNFHMGKGWSDIAYTAGACPHGFLLAGRGAGVRTAANGTNSGNYSYYAICGLLGGNQDPTAGMVAAWGAGVRLLRRDGGAGVEIRPHSSFKPTGCPGDPTRRRLDDIARAAQGGTTPPPAPSIGDDMIGLKRGDEGERVKFVQRLMYLIVPSLWTADHVDGVYGPSTAKMIGRIVYSGRYPDANDRPWVNEIDGFVAATLLQFMAKYMRGRLPDDPDCILTDHDDRLTELEQSTKGS